MDKTYYTVYRVTNKITGKFYIGTHKTTNLDDGYMGSGKYLKRAIERHGVENFDKEILFIYDNLEEMFTKEAQIVDEDFLAEENTYNLKIGGMGGFDHITKEQRSKNGKLGGLPSHKSKTATSKSISDALKEKYSNGWCKSSSKSHLNKMNKLSQSPTSQAKRRETMKNNKHGSGQRNSQYGTM